MSTSSPTADSATGAPVPAHEPPPLEPKIGRTSAPLSRMQQRLAFIQQLAPETPLYQVPGALRLRGKLDADLLVRCLTEMTSRHSALRSRVVISAGALTQEVSDVTDVNLERVDLCARPPAEREAALKAWLETESNRPLDIEKGPPVRFALLKLDEEDHVFFFMPHHFVWDGASIEIFLRELDQLYAAFGKGEPSPLRKLPIQYGDFAEWHEGYLKLPILDVQKAYWKDRLAGAATTLELPLDRPRPPRPSYRGGKVWWTLSAEEIAALSELGRKQGATLYMVLVAGFAALLQRYTNQSSLLIGTPVRGRLWARTQRLVGMFVNTVILRLDPDPGASFDDLLRQTKATCRGAFEHQDMPLDVLLRELNVPRDTSRAPLAQAFFNFRDTTDLATTMFGLPAEEITLYSDFETQDVSFWATQQRDKIVGCVTYAADILDGESVERMVGHYRNLLADAVCDPSKSIASLSLMSDDERREILAFAGPRAELPAGARVHDLIVETARQSPDAVAAVFGTEKMTYGELDRRSNKLARVLRALGVRRDVKVGLSVERSLRMLVAQLAILKAGGGYVPLDPGYPRERLAFMASDSEMKVLLTESAVAEAIAAGGAHVLLLDADADAGRIDAESDAPLPAADEDATSESLAYIIYTSGSTGQPKGVLVPHRAAVNLVKSACELTGLGRDGVLLAVTTLSFDISVFDTLGALAAGARIVIASRDMIADGETLAACIAEQGVTLLNATPATWRMLFAAGWQGATRFTAICTGEAFPREVGVELVKRASDVWNLYGPTETTVWSTGHKVLPPVERVLIGRPIHNTFVYIVDDKDQLQPIGVVGEILIGGDGVTQGYLKRPELTGTRFGKDPFRDEPNARIYRTGDIGRYLADGNLECLGRRDSQVKVRGYRIELGELEHTLAQHPSVAEAAVTVHEIQPGSPVLAAYVVMKAGATFSAIELRKHLVATLPSFMVPQHYTELAALPLSPAGKVDRRRLPVPAGAESSEAAYVEPRTPAEKIVAQEVMRILNARRVSMADSFFTIGGDSLLSLQLIAGLEKATGKHISPRVLIVNTLGQVAAMLPQSTEPTGETRPGTSSRAPAPTPPASPTVRGRLVDGLRKFLRK